MISCEFCQTVQNTIFKDQLGTPASVFIEHICITKRNVEMYTCEIKIRWKWEFIIFLHFWFCKFAIKGTLMQIWKSIDIFVFI